MPAEPFGLYVHVPFCTKKCRYCDFYSCSERPERIDRWLSLVDTECSLELENLGYDRPSVQTVYFGGGTPSLLSSSQFTQLAETVRKRFDLGKLVEWTLECNPESFTEEKAHAWIANGVTRLSIGIQSLELAELRILGRPHSREEALRVLSNSILSGFDSIGADVMYSVPGQTPSTAVRTVRDIVENGPVQHVSAYELTIGENTPFGRHARLLPLPSEETASEITEAVQLRLEKYGFVRYEVSNYSLPGFESRHNRGYWHHRPYIGLGPSAHSWIPPVRSAKESNLSRYMEQLAQSTLPIAFSETLNSRDLAREMIFLRLRTVEGVLEDELYRRTGYRFRREDNRDMVDSFIRNGLLYHASPFWRPTRKGLQYADGMAVDCAP